MVFQILFYIESEQTAEEVEAGMDEHLPFVFEGLEVSKVEKQ